MVNLQSGSTIWVSPNSEQKQEDGSRETPFHTIRAALNAARPGSVVVLTEGIYEESVTIQDISGEETKPITIMADPEAEAVILKGEWYLYNVSDCILTGLTFLDIPNTALSLIGDSKRNAIKEMLFINCGESAECTLFLAGQGGAFTVIENSQFTRSSDGKNRAIVIAQTASVEGSATLISQNTVVRNCHFESYTTAVLLGTGDAIIEAGNHLICDNVFVECREGIRAKAVASEIRDNIFRSCESAIVQSGGFELEIAGNRIESCAQGVVVSENDTTISENCFIDSAVVIAVEKELELPIIIAHNTFATLSETNVIRVQSKTDTLSAFVADNIFYIGFCEAHQTVQLHNNATISQEHVPFADLSRGDFTVSIAEGCHSIAAVRTAIAPIPQADLHEHGFDSEEAEQFTTSIDERDLYLKSLFVMNEDDMDDEIPVEEDDGSDDGEFYDFED